MQWVLTWLGGLLGGPFARAAVDAYRAKLEADGNRDKLAADLAAKAADLDAREAEVNARVVLAEQGNWATRWVRPVWAAPFVIYTWTVVVWDKVFEQGSTDPLDPRMWQVFMAMVVAYFGGRSAEKVATTIADAIRRK